MGDDVTSPPTCSKLISLNKTFFTLYLKNETKTTFFLSTSTSASTEPLYVFTSHPLSLYSISILFYLYSICSQPLPLCPSTSNLLSLNISPSTSLHLTLYL